MELKPLNETKFVEKKIIKTSEEGPVENHVYQYDLLLPDFLAEWDVWDYWEKARLFSMQENLSNLDVLFDVGTESGWMAALFSKYMCDNIVLMEPTAEFWPNIQAIWKENHLTAPLFTYQGLVGNRTTAVLEDVRRASFPLSADTEVLCVKNKYQYLHDNEDKKIPEITIDFFSNLTGLKPTALTVDVEGAELQVLFGAATLLMDYRPKVWVSIHPDLMARDYPKDTPEKLYAFMESLGYKAQILGEDHEIHVFFQYEEKV